MTIEMYKVIGFLNQETQLLALHGSYYRDKKEPEVTTPWWEVHAGGRPGLVGCWMACAISKGGCLEPRP